MKNDKTFFWYASHTWALQSKILYNITLFGGFKDNPILLHLVIIITLPFPTRTKIIQKIPMWITCSLKFDSFLKILIFLLVQINSEFFLSRKDTEFFHTSSNDGINILIFSYHYFLNTSTIFLFLGMKKQPSSHIFFYSPKSGLCWIFHMGGWMCLGQKCIIFSVVVCKHKQPCISIGQAMEQKQKKYNHVQ